MGEMYAAHGTVPGAAQSSLRPSPPDRGSPLPGQLDGGTVLVSPPHFYRFKDPHFILACTHPITHDR